MTMINVGRSYVLPLITGTALLLSAQCGWAQGSVGEWGRPFYFSIYIILLL
jgi:hypothetical protein